MANAGVSPETFANLHDTLAQYLLKALRGEDVPAAILKEAREFLKDNQVDGARRPGTALDSIASMPAMEQDEEEVPLRLVK